MLNYVVTTPVQLVSDDEDILVGYDLVEGDGLCALYNHGEGEFQFVCTSQAELMHMLASCSLQLKK